MTKNELVATARKPDGDLGRLAIREERTCP
jgi:hypothetical protein